MTMAVICPFSSSGSPVSGFKSYSGEALDVDVVRSSFSLPSSVSPPARRRVVVALLMGDKTVARGCLDVENDVDGRVPAMTRVGVDIIIMISTAKSEAQTDVSP